jgi:response regulator RpfG family c-di-GMP phosphodiesterase
MPTDHKPAILLVDDEEGILKALRRILRDLPAEVLSAPGGAEGLEILTQKPVSLIISDQRMPQMTGVEFLTKSMALAPDSIRILLTGYADIDATVEALNSGAVRYYMNKPWDDDFLLSRIKESLDLFKTTAENKRLVKLTREQNRKLVSFNQTLQKKVDEQTGQIKKQHQDLKKSFMDTIRAFSTIVGMRQKDVAAHSHRVATITKMMLDGLNMSEKDYQDVVVAAYLHDIGKIGLPDAIAAKAQDDCSPHEREVLYKHPLLGQSCVYNIAGFEDIGLIIRHHHENFDGTGYPDCLVGDQIPMGARILRVCDVFDHASHKDEYPDLKALTHATAVLHRKAGSFFDPQIIKLFDKLEIANQFYHDDSQGIIGLKPEDLNEGMVVAADIRTVNGVFLLPKGAKLSIGMIGRIRKIHAVDPIIEAIRVFSRSLKTEAHNVPA